MSTQIGRFEIVSQIAQSSIVTVYKALDTENQQTVALKVLRLDEVKDRDALVKTVFDEADQAKPLNSHNIAALYGVGDEEGQLLAATEYVQGNSVATTLARKDGFSIWDLQDIARQICHALDHAQVHKVVHQSLEPAKVMVQWDGMVKVLGFGISAMSAHAAESPNVPEMLHYASPEQLRGEAADHRSALFSLGAILYEMATEQKAFGGETPDQVRAAILERKPPLPHRLKANMNSGFSDLIMKAISKSPDERYQSGQELVRDLEQCKPNANTLAPASAQKPKAAAATAGGSTTTKSSVVATATSMPSADPTALPVATSTPRPKTAASSAPPAEVRAKPSFAVDPMMADDENSPAAAVRKSFSDMSELPPLKEIYVAPPTPAADEPDVPELLPQVVLRKADPEKARVQVREVAQRAVSEIRKTPPKLYLYAFGGAALVIALIVGYMSLNNYLADRDQTVSNRVIPPVSETQTPVERPQPVPTQPEAQPQAAEPEATQPEDSAPTSVAPAPTIPSRARKSKSRAAASAMVPAQLSVSSTPAGAEITFDGSALCQSPCNLTGIAPGQHVVAASKPGYSPESRTLKLFSGANSSLVIELTQLMAKLSVASTPAGAVILVDGKDTGKLTPSQLVLAKPGVHTVVLRRYGYLEETASTDTEAGQIANMNLILKPLGSTDEIRGAGGKFKKVFGSGDSASMGIVSIKTQPKGAQIMVNNRVLDKTTPFDFYLNPGTYVLDITMSGYRGVHRIINVGQRERVAIEEVLSAE
jgi:eukaryotic-like serine/threonine-protein kinase